MAELLRTFLPVVLEGLLAGFNLEDVNLVDNFEECLGLFAACFGLEDVFKLETLRLETDLVPLPLFVSIVRVLFLVADLVFARGWR